MGSLKNFFSDQRTIKNLFVLNAVIIVFLFIVVSVFIFYRSHQSIRAADKKELAFLLEQERSVLDQRFLSYKMTLESVQSLIHKAIRNKERIDEESVRSVTMALISSQPYVYSLFYALEPQYARRLVRKDYYIYALLKNFKLIGTSAFSEKKNIQMSEYFDGDYYKNPQGSNRNWYQDAQNATSIFMTKPYYDAAYLGLTLFSVVVPLKGENGEFAGIVGLDIPLAAFSIENAKRTSPLHYRALIFDQEGNSLERLIQEGDFKYPAQYAEDDVFRFDAKKVKITQEGKFDIKDQQGISYSALSAPIFDHKLKLVVIKSQKAGAALSGFYRDILLTLLALLPLQFLLTSLLSKSIYKNVKVLFTNFKLNSERIQTSRDVFTPVYIKEKLSYRELEDVRLTWENFLTEFQRTLQEIKVEKDRSLKALQFQSMFLANMSHEIRTPMNAIMGMVELLMETPLTEKQQEILKIFSSSSDSLLALLNDILDLAKIESGSLRIESVKTNLGKIQEDTLTVYRERAQNKNLDFSFDIDEDVDVKIKTDPVRLKQIIFNLVGNAIKFTEKGSVKVRISNDKKKSGQIVITVKDTGIGIEKHKTRYIFKKFTQADLSTTRKYGGSGLGLSIVKSLLKLMNGSITVKTKLNSGSTFTVILPVGHYEEDKKTPVVSKVDAKISETTHRALADKRLRVLIADDVFENRMLLEMYARSLGISCDLMENGEQAFEKAKTTSYNLIILDIQMPVMDGAEALKRIRALNNPNSFVPIVAFSAYASKADEEKYLDEGFTDYLTKPLSKDKFIACLSKHLITASSGPDLPS